MSVGAPAAAGRRRVRVRVHGTVQGVGFRPYVYRLAGELGLGGFVLNDSRGVLLEVEGARRRVARFLARLAPEAPPLAVLERVVTEERRPAAAQASRSREPARRARRRPCRPRQRHLRASA